ncbi:MULTISPECIES: aconitase X swivel domain-containing protein [Cupriavidus]
MSETIFTARHAMGRAVTGQALVAADGFSARYDLDRLQGVFSRPGHKLAGQSYVGRILVLDTAKGGVATAWMLHEMQSRQMAPLAIVLNSVNTILAQGAALGDVTLLAGFDTDITARIAHGAWVEIDPAARTLRVAEPPAQGDADDGRNGHNGGGGSGLSKVHGPGALGPR